MASWGSGGLLPHLNAKNQTQLELALAAIADPLPADPCCDTRVCVAQSRCGDGIVDPDEQCDDGNGGEGDGCKPNCFLEPPDETTGDETTTTGEDTSTTSDTTTDATSTSTTDATSTSTTDALTSTSTTTLDPTTTTSTTSTSTTLVPTSDGPSTTQGPGETSGTSTGSSTSTTDPAGTGGSDPPEGCSCTSDGPRTLNPALLLALAALLRRRRRI
ncbi:MYXO-CTERM sorting domain-containing protein [Nannocystis pusilla]|uniref:MYXO-CTERM sorting domain-containing protein n=1 Tax=Nannocystis pusilla TaxID=889268 RepID=UPI003B833C41